jgi:hypothetical protein
MADFDFLPNSESSSIGFNAPVVSKKLEKSHEKLDFKNYLINTGYFISFLIYFK